eukprot:8326522-Pyramimonas_sp.AAC.1
MAATFKSRGSGARALDVPMLHLPGGVLDRQSQGVANCFSRELQRQTDRRDRLLDAMMMGRLAPFDGRRCGPPLEGAMRGQR